MRFLLRFKALHPILKNRYLTLILRFPRYLIFNKNFIKDSSPKFEFLIQRLLKKEYTGALILGNAQNLNNIDQETIDYYRSNNFLIIGLNRSALRFEADIQLWADPPAVIDIIKAEKFSRSKIYVKASNDFTKEIFYALQFWEKNKSISSWPNRRLFMLRTILTSALDICFRLKLKQIDLVGIDLETRNYFYNNTRFAESAPYEQLDVIEITEKKNGYCTQKIVKELLESLISKEKLSINSLYRNTFLESIKGLEFKTLENVQSQKAQN